MTREHHFDALLEGLFRDGLIEVNEPPGGEFVFTRYRIAPGCFDAVRDRFVAAGFLVPDGAGGWRIAGEPS